MLFHLVRPGWVNEDGAATLRVCELMENHRNYRPQLADFIDVKLAQIGLKSIYSQPLSLKLKAGGAKRFNAEVAGSLPSLTLARESRRAVVAAKDFKVNVTGDEKVFRVAIEHMLLV